MSPRNIPIEEFEQLDRRAVACALRLIESEVDGTLALLATDETARRDSQVLDDLTSLLTLRKVFRARLAQLIVEEKPEMSGVGRAPALAIERYKRTHEPVNAQ